MSKRLLVEPLNAIPVQIESAQIPYSGERVRIDVGDLVAPQYQLTERLSLVKKPTRNSFDSIGPQLQHEQTFEADEQSVWQRADCACAEVKLLQVLTDRTGKGVAAESVFDRIEIQPDLLNLHEAQKLTGVFRTSCVTANAF